MQLLYGPLRARAPVMRWWNGGSSMCSQRGAACSPVTSIELAQAKAAKRERTQAKQKAKEAARKATEDAGRTARAAKRSIHGEA